jgi:hypothetical protein
MKQFYQTLHMVANAPKNKFNIHPGSSYKATCTKSQAEELSMQYASQNGRFHH